ncbi:YegS/Rv2252/BmrU family lipid kinase [Alkalibaculum bacchi]|uniref:YegS/Rv2252/BmrU family lipid kinase n=1 Tax=Alkalibaculum bacchi TaxID=645887 RepID=A0A366IAH7_9FIRM|nr:diacylglycerol kinase family protein [Alkalibaculum bacchi]RBP67316.1 YegS/Rv2252/BmrU family lipid kinase [Alkalibaculum bacchi]
MKLFFVLNPVAGKGKSIELMSIIKRICEKENVEYMIKLTPRVGGAEDTARWGIENNYKRIIAVGGDGTVNEVVNGIVGSKTVLGVVPAGSGNDFVRSIGDPKEPEQYILDTIHGKVKTIDLGMCNDRYFINMASIGLDTQVAIRTQKTKKYFSGSLAYLVSALLTIFSYKGWDLNIQIDDQAFHAKTLLTAIANGKFYGGGVLPAPDAKLDDGYFDICHVKHMSKEKMFRVLPKYMKGKHRDIKEVQLVKGKEILITSDNPFPLNLDGEVSITNKAHFKLIEKGIDIIVP